MQDYLGMYDISCNKVRRQVFHVLAAYGIHRQKSVFECRLNLDSKNELFDQLYQLTQGHQNNIVFLQIFPRHPDTVLFGSARFMPSSDCLYIG